MNKIIVYGNYMANFSGFGGQITKTRNVFNYLSERFGSKNVAQFNIENWKRRPLSTLYRFKKILKKYKKIVILPGDNNFKFLIRFLPHYIKKYKVEIYYSVVGGWLFDAIKNSKKKVLNLSLFRGVYVETLELKAKLESLGLTNIFYSPVFSLRRPISIEKFESIKSEHLSFSFCSFCRVTKEKGIIDAIEGVKLLNQRHPEFKTNIDIYGKIDPKFKSEFNQLLSKYEFVKYKGFIDDDKVIETLSKYRAMIFATYYLGEGFPATILEANMSGLPVVASDFRYNKELVLDNETGFIFRTHNVEELANKLYLLVSDNNVLNRLRIGALHLSRKYTADRALEKLCDDLTNDN